MEGRWKRFVCAALVAGAFGCTRKATVDPSPFGMKQESRSFSFLPKSQPAGAPGMPPPIQNEDENKPASADAMAAWADVQSDAAFIEGRAAPDRDRMIDSARQIYQKALERDPKNKASLVGLSNLYARSGDQQRAIEMLQVAIQNHPKDHELAHKLASVHIRFRDWPGAAQACQHALSIDPENRTYRKTLGYCQAQQDQWQAAGETLMQVMPEAKARYFLSRVLIDQQRFAEAKQQLELAVQLDPQYEQARYVLADLDAGRVAPKLNDPNPVLQAGFEESQQQPAQQQFQQ